MNNFIYVPNVKSQKEFLLRFEKLFEYFKNKQEKNSAENALYETLTEVYQNIYDKKILECNKESYCNMLPYFEFNGGFEMMDSEIGKEATDLLYYFVQNY